MKHTISIFHKAIDSHEIRNHVDNQLWPITPLIFGVLEPQLPNDFRPFIGGPIHHSIDFYRARRPWRCLDFSLFLFDSSWLGFSMLLRSSLRLDALKSLTKMSSDSKLTPVVLGKKGGWNTTLVFCRDYFINHEIRIPSLNNQDLMDFHKVFEHCS